MRGNDAMFWFSWVMMIIGGIVIILTAMLRRQKIIEMAHKERLAMIERGMVPPRDSVPDPLTMMLHARTTSTDTRSRMLSGGIVVVAFGLGLMLMIGVAGQSPEAAVGVGGAIAVLGAAFIVIAMVQRNQPLPPLPPPSSPFPPPPYGSAHTPPPAPPRNHTE